VRLIKARFLWTLLLVLVASVSVPGYGQGTSASLTGQVTDPTGAAIPGASVTIKNVDTNFEQSVKSDSAGTYLLKPLQPGNYSLTIAAPGFAEYVQKGIVLNANLYATQDVHLTVGSGKGETVSVTADAELINTTSAELGTTINEYAVSQLPLNGRDPSSLVLLAPGMIDGVAHGGVLQSGFSFPTEQGASANGGRQGSTYYMLDGVSNMDNYMALTSPMPNSDATQEFRLISNNYSAIYGFSSGGVVSIATKSGANQFHGGVFEFLRNQDLNAKSWFSHQLDPLKRNQFGGFVGGPVLRDKLFFFGNYQGTRSVGAGSSSFTHTPTTAMLNGDFSGLANFSGFSAGSAPSPTYLNGPFVTTNGIPNQLAPGVALDPMAVQIVEDGLPGHSSGANQDSTGGMYYSTGATRQNYDEGTGRLDYDLSKSQRLTLRSFTDNFVQPSGDVPGNILSVLNLTNWQQGFGERMEYYNDVLQHTWTINANSVNTASVFWSEQSAHNSAATLDGNKKPMCFSRYINITELPSQCYMEGFSVSNGFNGGWTEPSQEVRNAYGFSDTFTTTVHRHTISVGMDLQHQFAEELTQYPTTAIVGFGGSYTGNGVADFLLGYMSSFEQGAGEIASIKGWQLGPYVNDEFRLRPNLMLTIGLRWDPNLPPTSVGGRGAAFVLGQQSTMFPNAPTGLIFPGDKGMTPQLMPASYGYWDPRVGVAFQPRALPHTAFHAGFGLFTGPLAYSQYNHVADVAPFSPTFVLTNPSNSPICSTGGVQNPNGTCHPNTGEQVSGYMNFHDPWQTPNAGTGGVSPFPPFASTSFKPSSDASFPSQVNLGASFARNFKQGVTQSWNASAEQQLSQNMMVRVAYVGSETYHQSYIIDKNPGVYFPAIGDASAGSARALSRFTQILQENSDGTASYQSLQASFERHMSHGLQLQSSFTWQKTIDLASSSNISFNGGIGDPFDLRWNRGVSALSIPFNSVTNFIYKTPDLRGKNQLMRQTFGGWELSSIVTWQSGSPFGVSGGNGLGSGSLQSGDRADRVAGQSLKVRQGGRSHWLNSYFNTAAFVPRATGTFGSSGKNLMNGPPLFSTDAGLMKNWNLAERYNLQFRFEMFNAMNHVVMANPDANPSDGSYGQINGTANSPRVGQAALKFTF
jgi:hypothetical protein